MVIDNDCAAVVGPNARTRKLIKSASAVGFQFFMAVPTSVSSTGSMTARITRNTPICVTYMSQGRPWPMTRWISTPAIMAPMRMNGFPLSFIDSAII